MPNPFQKLKPGDRMEAFPSLPWNDLLDMLAAYKANKNALLAGTKGLDRETARTLVPVRNVSGGALARFSVVQLGSPIISSDDNLPHFKNRPTFNVDVPSHDLTVTPAGTFGILQDPLADDAIGLALIAGVTAVQIDMVVNPADFADAIGGDATKLRAFPGGCVPILSVDSGTGTQWGYVLLGNFQRHLFYGITDEAIADGATGTVSAYFGGTDSTINVEAVASMGAVGSGKLVCIVPRNPEWHVIQAPCT